MAAYLPEGHNFTIYANFYFGSFDGVVGLKEQGHNFTLACCKD